MILKEAKAVVPPELEEMARFGGGGGGRSKFDEVLLVTEQRLTSSASLS